MREYIRDPVNTGSSVPNFKYNYSIRNLYQYNEDDFSIKLSKKLFKNYSLQANKKAVNLFSYLCVSMSFKNLV